MSNIYYSPEKFGLEVVADIDKSSGSYEFDTFAIWKDKAGLYYWDNDAGCSCPSPFEDSDLSNVRVGSLKDAINDAYVWLGEKSNGWSGDYWDGAKVAIDKLKEQL